MPMHGVFRSLIEKPIRVELKNKIVVTGTMKDVDTFLNIKLAKVTIEKNTDNVFVGFKQIDSLFLRGSFVKFIWIKEADVRPDEMENAVRKTILYKKVLYEEKEKEEIEAESL
ncbi:U6 snRNA-associated Sm-like protein LSm2 [Nematocida sp. AWRm77]|nr:U6 snRNA-associated Sm-like protein LSm2 [Nematocida sp. AWRm77]